ncbi:MAG TPA: Smr/MutS family protein, partial [Tissierellaceae bacterium]|nr:Smr/MutS family protein [Tissierellaceae bacterium]
ENGNLNVQVGIMKVNVHINTLRRTEANIDEDLTKRTRNIITSKSKTIKNEIDLRGSTIEEAILDLDKYLDDSYIAGLKEVYVIHGKGTGALRKGLQDYFKRHRLIKSFRLGEYGEGGSGVTIVRLI